MPMQRRKIVEQIDCFIQGEDPLLAESFVQAIRSVTESYDGEDWHEGTSSWTAEGKKLMKLDGGAFSDANRILIPKGHEEYPDY